jgi:hypothetical protein
MPVVTLLHADTPARTTVAATIALLTIAGATATTAQATTAPVATSIAARTNEWSSVERPARSFPIYPDPTQ